ncbi:MAG: hypothetical protein CVV22_07150 [Ignavibacteriae bacterium HGW-Ignavibacteriae-1]|nr:MAG: hypothetical protein CVV22_07150 [Ignavibacteriae bacterium HGW-Ignavibacteriae-1]
MFKLFQLILSDNQNMNSMKIFAFISFLLILSVNLYSQNPQIKVSADTNNVLIGEHVKLTFEYLGQSDDKVTFPILGDTLGPYDIIEIGNIDTSKSDRNLILKRIVTVTSFDTGMVFLPSIPFVYERQDYDTAFVANSDELALYFATVQLDTAADLKDIKGPIEIPITFAEMLPYILGGLGVALLIVAIVVLLKRRKRKVKTPIIEKYDPTIPADLEALQALKELENKKIWQQGRHKFYHSDLTDILRTYIHRIYDINAHELTSDEILSELQSKEPSPEALDILQKILSIADLTKFAKFTPSDTQNHDSMTMAVAFVNQTKSRIMLETSETSTEEKHNV